MNASNKRCSPVGADEAAVMNEGGGNAQLGMMPPYMQAAVDEVVGKIAAGDLNTRLFMQNAAAAAAEVSIKQQFLTALTAFQRRYIPPVRNACYVTAAGETVHYVTLDQLLNHIRPLLTELGLSVRWGNIFLKAGVVYVTCIVAHIAGEECSCQVTLPLARAERFADQTQCMASTATLAKRHALMAVLGLSTNPPPAADDVMTAAARSGQHILMLNDSLYEHNDDWTTNRQRCRGGTLYNKLVTLYRKRLRQLLAMGVTAKLERQFTAFADFINEGEPSYEDIIYYGKRLTRLLRQTEEQGALLVRGRSHSKSPAPVPTAAKTGTGSTNPLG